MPGVFWQPRNRFLFDAAWFNGAPQFGNEITYAAVLALCDVLHDRLQNRIGVAGKVRSYLLATLGGTRAWITSRHISASRSARFVGNCATKALRFAISSTSCGPRWR